MSDSLITKKAIAASMKELMKRKSLEKITVSDIVQNCGLNRQTFYYHFQDKYDLVNWIYYNEVVSVIAQKADYHDWSEVVLDVLNIMKRNRRFYISALNVNGQNAFQEYFFNVTKDVLLELINGITDHRPQDDPLEEDEKNFIAEFYTYGLVGVVVQWARSGMREPPEEIASRLRRLVEDSRRVAALRFLNGKRKGGPPAH
ncbi:MAG TPA: dihydroxyacetone kinase transcriptional activator DhaS [Ruminococcaceae bacterium]|jgi:probable dihydroxyacetone kinase regulator|nr:dihydroxyacetone kinase transcriptional activator DhaS [Oscillospiraceae bacterium]